MDAQDVVLKLRAQNINVSAARVEHARLGLETRGVVSLARASVHYYVSEEQIIRFGKAIKSLL
jgi:selenocysteine lyase/cysteine desulfurase